MKTTERIQWSVAMAVLAAISLCLPSLRAGDAPPAAGAGGDEEALDVVYRTGHIAQPPIKITQDDWLLVKGEHGNFKPEYEASTIDQIDYHDRTARWNLAMERIQQKNWSKALVNFKKMFNPDDPGYAQENPAIAKCAWSAEIGNYYYGLVLLKDQQPKLAAEKYMASFAAKATGRYSLLALLGAADAYLQAGQTDDSLKVLKQFDDQLQVFNKAFEDFKFPVAMVEGKLHCRQLAEVLNLQAKYVGAKVQYQKAMDAAQKGDAIPPEAEAACDDFVQKATSAIDHLDKQLNLQDTKNQPAVYAQLLAQWHEMDAQMTQVSNMLVDIRIAGKDFDGARQKCQATITAYETTRDPRMVSRMPAAYAGLGKVSFFEAANLQSKNDPIKAQKMYAKSRWYYQHVMVMYFDNTRYLQDALYYTGMCNEQLAKLSIEKDARERAYDNFKRLAEMLPETDPRYKDVVAALERTKPSGGAAAPMTPAAPANAN